MKLSACMMVKNEAENLPRCLRALKDLDVFDEIVVVDTGSTDETVEIAREAGARVVIPEDLDSLYVETEFGRAINFSKARNITIDEASGDWLYLLDADEETVGDAKNLRDFIAKLKPEVDALAIAFEDYKKGRVFMRFMPPRIFKRGHIWFENIVHNKPRGYTQPAIFYPGIKIKHTGFDLTPEQAKAKKRRTLGLLRKQLEDDPGSFWCYFYIAQIYGDLQDYPATIEASVKYIENREKVETFNPSIYYVLAQACILGNDGAAADKWIGAAIRELPDDIDIAAAVCDFGAWRKAPHILITGCEMYLRAWDKLAANPLALGARFIYNYNPETLARVLFHLQHMRLQQGKIHLMRLRDLFGKLGEENVGIIKSDLAKEHKTIGVSVLDYERSVRVTGGPENGKREKGRSRKIDNLKKRRFKGGRRVRSRKVRDGVVQVQGGGGRGAGVGAVL